MKIPTILQFNNWSEKDKLWWIEYESEGKYKQYSRAEGYFPFIIYEKENIGIVYQVNNKGELVEALAMTVKEAFDRLLTFEKACKAVASTNALS